jgi:hypothetical protein
MEGCKFDMPEFTTRAAIWFAMLAWTWAMILPFSRARLAWSLGFVAYLVHIVLAVAVFYEGSHAVALAETARQTLEKTGWPSGAGLWVNYALALVLALDLAWQWSGRAQWQRPWVNGFVLFMILNGAVVFGSGPVRIFGAILLLVPLVVWLTRLKRSVPGSS